MKSNNNDEKHLLLKIDPNTDLVALYMKYLALAGVAPQSEIIVTRPEHSTFSRALES